MVCQLSRLGWLAIQGGSDEIGLHQRRNVLATGSSRVAVVDQQSEGRRASLNTALVTPARQAVVPETTVPHDADRLVWQRVAHPPKSSPMRGHSP